MSFSKLEVHNNYISQTLKYGLLPALCFHILPFIVFFKSVYRIIKHNCHVSIIPFGLSFYIILYYIFETSSAIMLVLADVDLRCFLNNRYKSDNNYEKNKKILSLE